MPFIAGGDGADAVRLAAHGHQVTVVDHAPSTLAAARERADAAGVNDLVSCGEVTGRSPAMQHASHSRHLGPIVPMRHVTAVHRELPAVFSAYDRVTGEGHRPSSAPLRARCPDRTRGAPSVISRPSPKTPSARQLHTYLLDAVQEIRKTGLLSSTVDWDAVDRQARAVLDTAGCYADTHAFLATLLHQAGGRHSHLTPPGPTKPRQPGPLTAAAWGPPTPTGHLIGTAPAAVAYLRLPMLPDGRKPTRRYLADGTTVMSSLIAARPCGWIVDLRANLGGQTWPMLAVAAPLLPDGVLGHFLLPDGHAQTWSAHRGRITLDRKTMARSRTPRPPDDHTPIAVLTSRHTASAGEAVALAFCAQPRAHLIGTPTAGLTTGNRTHVLRDGTRLRISGAVYADRHRNPIEGPIPIDRHLTDNSREAALNAALAWIRHHGPPPHGTAGTTPTH